MMEVTPQTIMDFTKLLIECGDVYEVQPDYTIKNRLTGEQVQIAKGKQAKPLMIFHEGASCVLDVCWLNPFKENLGVSREREWFFGLITTLAGTLTRYIAMKLIDDGVKKKDDNYEQFALMSKINSKVDEQMLTEVDKLTASAFLSVYYNKREKIAEAQTELFGKELREAFPKFRKKTWEVLETIFVEIFGSTDLSDYRYRAKLINIPETEAKLNVSIALLRALDPFARDILGKDLHTMEMEQHLEVLEGYSRLYAWAPVNQDTNGVNPPNTTPWSNTQYAPVPVSASPVPAGFAPIPGTAPVYGSPVPAGNPLTSGMVVPVTNDIYAAAGYGLGLGGQPQDSASGIFGVPLR